MSSTSGGPATEVQDRPGSPPSGDSGVREQAEQAAGTAAEEGKHVASVAGDEAQKVVRETQQQAQELFSEARTQLADQAKEQQHRLAQMLGSVSEDLDRMSSQGGSGIATDLVRQAAQHVRGLGGRLDGREPTDLLEDVRRFARQRPGTFLVGALAAGVVAGRFARGLQQSQQGSSTPSAPVPAQRSQAADSSAGGSTATRTTPQAGALADFPADRPGGLS